MQLSFRTYSDSDLNDVQKQKIHGFMCESFEYNYPFLPRADYRYLVWSNETIISHCAIVEREIIIKNIPYSTYFLGGFCTAKAFRKSGIGSRLIKYLITSLGNTDKQMIILNCGVGVLSFYTKNGFSIISDNAVYKRDGIDVVDHDPVLAYLLDDSIDIEELRIDRIYLGEDF